MSNSGSVSISRGIKWGALVTAALLFVPPLVVSWLPVWTDATHIAMQDARLIAACGEHGQISLSKWFYMYKVSGEYESASFSGRVSNASCNKGFRIDIERNGGAWQITKLKLG
jgi:hypothetical protein